MSFARKIFRNAAKAELKKRGYPRPNKLAWHRNHGVKVDKMAIDRLTDLHVFGRSKKKRRAKRRSRV